MTFAQTVTILALALVGFEAAWAFGDGNPWLCHSLALMALTGLAIVLREQRRRNREAERQAEAQRAAEAKERYANRSAVMSRRISEPVRAGPPTPRAPAPQPSTSRSGGASGQYRVMRAPGEPGDTSHLTTSLIIGSTMHGGHSYSPSPACSPPSASHSSDGGSSSCDGGGSSGGC